jgi:hypothetical protein
MNKFKMVVKISRILTVFTVLIVTGCSSSDSSYQSELTEKEIKETESVEDMIKSDSLKMDSMRRAMGLD